MSALERIRRTIAQYNELLLVIMLVLAILLLAYLLYPVLMAHLFPPPSTPPET